MADPVVDVDDVFSVNVDHYRGVTVQTSAQNCRNVAEFESKLQNSLQKWTVEVNLHLWIAI